MRGGKKGKKRLGSTKGGAEKTSHVTVTLGFACGIFRGQKRKGKLKKR